MQDIRITIGLVAKHFGARVRTCKEYDPNVCQFSVDPRVGWEPSLESGAPLTKEARFLYAGRRIALSSNSEVARFKIEGKLEVGVCSINIPNKAEFLEQSNLSIRTGDWAVFVPRGTDALQSLDAFLHDPVIERSVADLLIDSAFSLHIYDGAVVYYARPESENQVLRFLSLLSKFVDRLDPSTASLIKLPESFHPLIPLIEQWSASDDSERSMLLANASRDSLEELVRTVTPYIEQIEKYLALFHDNVTPDQVTALSDLAEAAVQARIELLRPRFR